MGLLGKLFGQKNLKLDWEQIKKSEAIYPKNSISILRLKTKSGNFGTGWVDKAYKDYAYKRHCPYNFLIMVDLTDTIAQSNPDLDMGTIQEYFIKELRQICVAHMVSRVVTDEGMNIEMYLEDDSLAMKHLQTILDNPKRIVSFNCEVNKDPKWSAIGGLMNL